MIIHSDKKRGRIFTDVWVLVIALVCLGHLDPGVHGVTTVSPDGNTTTSMDNGTMTTAPPDTNLTVTDQTTMVPDGNTTISMDNDTITTSLPDTNLTVTDQTTMSPDGNTITSTENDTVTTTMPDTNLTVTDQTTMSPDSITTRVEDSISTTLQDTTTGSEIAIETTPTDTTTTTAQAPVTTTINIAELYEVRLKVRVNKTWNAVYDNPADSLTQQLRMDFKTALTKIYRNKVKGFMSVRIDGFKQGSVVAIHTVLMEERVTPAISTAVALILAAAVEDNNNDLEPAVNGVNLYVVGDPVLAIPSADGSYSDVTVPAADAVCFLYNELGTCQNQGTCVPSGAGPLCVCTSEYSGDTCEEPVIPPTKNNAVPIALGCIGVIVVVFAAFFAILYTRRAHRQNRRRVSVHREDPEYRSEKEEEYRRQASYPWSQYDWYRQQWLTNKWRNVLPSIGQPCFSKLYKICRHKCSR